MPQADPGAAQVAPAPRSRLLAIILALIVACTGDPVATSTTAPPTSTTETTVEPNTTTTEPECPDTFCVRYHIHPDATWADGRPVTADDFAFTYELIIDPATSVSTRRGYDRISGYRVEDDKTIVFAFSEVYAPWQDLFRPVLPAHVLHGQDFNTVWDEGITLGSGPFTFTRFAPGEGVTLTRNPDYWGDATGDVQAVEISFLGEADDIAGALGGGAVDVIYPEPDPGLMESVTAMGGVEWQAGPGRTWEHFEFNFDDSRLQQLHVRQAIAQAVNRQAIVDALVAPILPDASPLGNTIWLSPSQNYIDHFNTRFPYDPVAAEALLTENGCVTGEDGIYACDGERLSFTWTSTSGRPDREILFQMAQADLAAVGIELTPRFGPPSQVFLDQFFYGGADQWQVFNFAWVGSHDPSMMNTLYQCEGDAPNGFGRFNNLRYCNEEVDSLIRQTDSQVDPVERAATYNQADELWLGDVPLVPLFEQPNLLAWNEVITGPRDNASIAGPFWNIGDWAGKETVVFGHPTPPGSMNILEPEGGGLVTSLVSAAALEGAYTITPEFEYEPRLVASAETIVSD